MHDVVLVLMPYASVERPSLALGTLQACLLRAGISAHAMHATLRFADAIGLLAYEGINNSVIGHRIGEWTFAGAAFPDDDLQADEYLETLSVLLGDPPGYIEQLRTVRAMGASFVDSIAREVLLHRPRIVGCSSVFKQQAASLALLRRIRELDPSVVTMLGGGNCEGEMGWVTHQSFDWVDYVVSGEADELLAPLCRDIFAMGRDVPKSRLAPGVFGPAHRGDNAPPSGHALYARVRTMANVPEPVYDEYFDELARCHYRAYVLPGIAVETARGCWWGEKHHCSFCGISDSGMVFRAKPAAQVLAELDSLHARYGINRFVTADNIIETSYFDTLMPVLAGRDYALFYQTKANLKRRHVELLAEAGVRWIQPGIESLDDRVLPLLAKGASAAINVQLLKWCRSNGVWVLWNMLFGAPGEEDAWYAELAEWLPLIVHLQPPSAGELSAIRYNRFSPYFENAAELGLELVPAWAYRFTYPHGAEERARQAYYFTDANDVAGSDRYWMRPGVQRVNERLRDWTERFIDADASPAPTVRADAPMLTATADGERLLIRDTRPCAVAPMHVLSGLAARVYRACDAATTPSAIAAALDTPLRDVDEIVSTLRERNLVLDLGGRVLALAVDDPPAPYRTAFDFPAGLLLRTPHPDTRETWDLPLTAIFPIPSVYERSATE
ncbi:MAG TPA: RiPP maturation radical SAM C-methyltransferase [Thermoanaerobaculia bacterium]|nr:RiPP maturation radical SAM C-methyltransferase [Thermoanaerobaculia bacterium]